MSPDEAEQHARKMFLHAGTAFFRAGQVAAWTLVVYALVALVERLTG